MLLYALDTVSHVSFLGLPVVGKQALILILRFYFYECSSRFGVKKALMRFNTTRKLGCRKDDRAMRPILYECPENFLESLTTPTATFPEIFNGLFFRLMP